MKKILEIGGGRTLYFIRYEISCNITDSYISIDISDEYTNHSKQKLEEYKKKGGICPHNISMTVSDATSLRLEDNSIDEIVISNTLSAPIHWGWDRDGNMLKIETPDGTRERPIPKANPEDDPFYVERKNIIGEAKRVLKPGGFLSIYTDLIIYGTDSYLKILEELKNTPSLIYTKDGKEEERINMLNIKKLASNEFCCCFRAEVLPKSEVHRFFKKL